MKAEGELEFVAAEARRVVLPVCCCRQPDVETNLLTGLMLPPCLEGARAPLADVASHAKTVTTGCGRADEPSPFSAGKLPSCFHWKSNALRAPPCVRTKRTTAISKRQKNRQNVTQGRKSQMDENICLQHKKSCKTASPFPEHEQPQEVCYFFTPRLKSSQIQFLPAEVDREKWVRRRCLEMCWAGAVVAFVCAYRGGVPESSTGALRRSQDDSNEVSRPLWKVSREFWDRDASERVSTIQGNRNKCVYGNRTGWQHFGCDRRL